MSNPTTRQPSKQVRRRDRREEEQRREGERRRAAQRTRNITIFSIIAIVLIVGITVYFVSRNAGTASGTTASTPGHPAVDGVSCDQAEQLAFHIHAHVSIYINGSQVALPSQIGIPTDGACYYWLHTHDTSGVIHMEAPVNQTFTLGNFLDIWDQQFNSLGYPTQLASSAGWQVYVDGKLQSGDLRNVKLSSHELITLAYQSPGIRPDAPNNYSWSADLPQ